MKVGFFSPLPPAATGVADYSSTLLPLLRSCGTVEIVSEKAPENCDVALYHVGNNALHGDIYRRALTHPGVVVLHDAVLQHLLLGMLNANEYVEEFVYNYGETSRDLGRQLWEQRARSGADARYFTSPMLKRIATASLAIIVHNPAATKLVREHVPQTPVVEIPHLFERPSLPSPEETLRFRETLGLTPETLLIGTFGHQRETKRLTVLLRAFQRAGANARLLVSGDFVSGVFENAVAPLLEHPGVIRTGYLPEPELWRYAAATDLCINLRYPSAAETSGIAIRMMGIGKPVIFTAGEALARIPANACLKLDVGPDEEPMLAGYIEWLAENREAGLAIGRRAAAHIAECHAPEKVAREYWNVLNKYRGA
jgi:glycosyltransferase involved in cell wall biosynthesis